MKKHGNGKGGKRTIKQKDADERMVLNVIRHLQNRSDAAFCRDLSEWLAGEFRDMAYSIKDICSSRGKARIIEVLEQAERLGVALPSTVQALNRLAETGKVKHLKYGEVKAIEA